MAELITPRTHGSVSELLKGIRIGKPELCEILGTTPKSLDKILALTRVPGAVKGSYDLVSSIQAYCAAVRAARGVIEDQDRGAQMLIDKARASKAKADLLQMEADYRAGKLAKLDDVIAVLGERFVRFRSRILAIPSRAAPILEGESAAEIHRVLSAQCREALQELSTEGLRPGNDSQPPARRSVQAYSGNSPTRP